MFVSPLYTQLFTTLAKLCVSNSYVQLHVHNYIESCVQVLRTKQLCASDGKKLAARWDEKNQIIT